MNRDWYQRLLGAFALSALLAVASGTADAAGGAFAVDDAGVDDPGECKVEAFTSFGRDRDFIGTIAPACTVRLARPVELGLEVTRERLGGEWATGLTLKAKTAIVPLEDDGAFGMAIAGGVGFDLTERETAEWFLTVPVSIRVAAPLLLNFNAGVLRDAIDHRTHFTWGAGFMYTISEPLTLIGEVFGQSSEKPAAQLGLRYTPVERVDFDLIYGYNLAGERASWVTVGMNLRF